MKILTCKIRILLTIFIALIISGCIVEGPFTNIIHLRVQSIIEPLAIEDENLLFSWQMASNITGQKQTAYQITVNRERDGEVYWDTRRVNSGLSNNVRYEGQPLDPETAYSWELTVWDNDGQEYSARSRFETGLMNPGIEAWEGAKFIGSNELTLNATSAMLFEINTDFQIKEGSDAASVILGADDFRFTSAFLNPESIQGENYIRLELDISGVGTGRGAVLNVYRVGYGKNDSKDIPYMVISSGTYPETNINRIITAANKHDIHNLNINVSVSIIIVSINGQPLLAGPPAAVTAGQGGFGAGGNQGQVQPQGLRITISNYRTGHNFNTYPNMNSVGFASRPGDEIVFTNYRILNLGVSDPANNVVFGPASGATTHIFAELPGVTVSSDGTEITVKNDTNEPIIGYTDPSHGSLTMVRTDFSTPSGKSINNAKLYVTSMGSNEVFINGERVGEDWFTPGMTQFRETLGYYAYDVTGMISNGPNSIGAILNPGFYTGYMTFRINNFNLYGDTEALLAKLVITYSDGSRETVVTHPDTWMVYKDGPIEYGSFFQGERYNANKEVNISVDGNINGWATPGYDDSSWSRPEIVEKRDWIDFDILARYDQPVRVAEILPAVKVMDVHCEDGLTYTYDMGVNMVGVPSVKIPAGWLQAGDVVIMRYGEQIYPGFPGDVQEYIDLYGYTGEGSGIAGRILTETYRAALATDFYVAAGNGEVVIEPTTTHRGYQYIQITIPNGRGPLPLDNVKGIVLSSDQSPTGTYHATTSDVITGEYVNQLFANIQRSQLGNFFTIPYDCPQRNERMGWTGDAQVYVRTGTYNSDARVFFRQWMLALRNDQGVGSETDAPGSIGSTIPDYVTSRPTTFSNGTTWAGAVCMVPWQLYIQYGDKQIIEENIETMMLWLDGMHFYDFSDEYTYLSARTGGLSDWLARDGNTPPELLNNSIYIYLMRVTAKMAEAIGRYDYAEILRERHELARAEWNEVYVDPSTGKTRNADGSIVHTQSSYAQPLSFNTFSDDNYERAQAYMAELAANPSASNTGEMVIPEFTITTGFAGTPHVLPSLTRSGHVEEAYNMFTSTEYASWLYPVTMGATSVWERWNGYEAAFGRNNQNNMNSFNHFALGAVGEWMYEYQLGIKSDYMRGGAGYKHFILQPVAGGNFTELRGSYDSNYGTISSHWRADGNGKMTSYTARVPANTSATLYLPADSAIDNFGVTEGVVYKGITVNNSITVAEYELTSGEFKFNISGGSVSVSTKNFKGTIIDG